MCSSCITSQVMVLRRMAVTIAIAGVGVIAAPQAGFAQTSGIEEVVVTARKRVENLQDIPEAITAFSNEEIKAAGLDSIDDVSLLVPNFSIVNSQNVGNNLITMRGISQVRFGEPPVAFIIDGVQSASPNNFTQELFDIQRIEILRGPQGAVYGRNAIGGAINITTMQPSNEFEQSVLANIGEGSYAKVQGSSSGPIVEDKFLYRIAASYRDDDGLIDNVTRAETVDFGEELSARASFLYLPTDSLSVDVRASWADYKGGASYFAPTYPALGESEGSRSPVEANTLGRGERELADYSVKIDYDMQWGTVTSVSSLSKIDEFFFQDIDFLAIPIVNLDQTLDLTAFSQELRLTSNDDSDLNWQIGLYYLETDRDVRTRVFLDFDPVLGPVISDLPENNNNLAYAVFGQVDYDVTDKVNVALALRQDWDDREQLNPITNTTVSKTFSKFQPKIAVTYFLADDAMAYVSAGRGFRSGGFNVPSLLFPPLYEDETVDTYEVGLKGTWLDRQLQVNAAVFHTDNTNTQVFRFDAGSGTQGVLNVNNSQIDGIEVELLYRPTSALRLSAGVGLIDSTIKDFNGTQLYRGNQVPLINESSHYVSAEYVFELRGGLTITPRLDYSSYGDLAWAIDNVDQRTSNVNLVNLRISLGSESWTLTAYAENLTDEEYDAEFNPAEFVGTPTDIYFPAPRRRIGIEARYRF